MKNSPLTHAVSKMAERKLTMEKCNRGNIFLVLHCLVILVQSLDFILVMRWNKQMGLPDFLFFLGDEILGKGLNCWGLCFFGFDLFCCCGFTLQFSYFVTSLFCFGCSLAFAGLGLFDMCFPYIVARSLFQVQHNHITKQFTSTFGWFTLSFV